jgi:DNA polymerase-3 subunit beta
MKVQLNREQFDDALSVVAGAAAARASLPILSHLYIEAQSDTVRIIGSDLEQWVECRIPALVGEDGATTLPARAADRTSRLAWWRGHPHRNRANATKPC